MNRGLNDKTKTGYNGRLVRLNKKLGAVKWKKQSPSSFGYSY
jgi:hypothetical protein